MHIHIIGVAGTLMGSLAGLLVRLGHRVTGSDVRFYDPMGSALRRWGVECFEGFRAEHVLPGRANSEGSSADGSGSGQSVSSPDRVIIGNVCRSDNPEARAAIDAGVRYMHVAEALREFALDGTRPLVVAGTHGKTTTTAMAAFLLDACGQAPGFLIGGVPLNFSESFRNAPEARKRLPTLSTSGIDTSGSRGHQAAPRRSAFVIEGDEYDTAFFEKTPKFLHYGAQVAVISSIEHDHIDIYPTFVEYCAAFREFITRMPLDGLLVANAADPNVVELVSAVARCEVAWYSVQRPDALVKQGPSPVAPPSAWYAAPAIINQGGTQFDLFAGGSFAGRWHVPMVGTHNVSNAVAAIAACAQGYGVGLEDLRRALSSFRGIKRRQELREVVRGICIYDDFAHHPSAVAETLAGLKAKHPEGKLFVAFEPRSATACRSLHQTDYSVAFDAADIVYLAPLGRDNIPETERLNLNLIAESLSRRGKLAFADIDVANIVSDVSSRAVPGDTVVVLSNGDFSGVHQRLIASLR